MEKIIHQIWVGPYNIPDIEKEYINIIKKNNSECKYMFWTDQNLPELPAGLKIVYDNFGKAEDYAFQADLLRLFVVYKFGGLYLDVDFEHIHALTDSNFFNYDGVFFYHKNLGFADDLTIPNGIFGSKKESKILEFIVNTINTHGCNGWLGPSWFGENIRRYFNLSINASHDMLNEDLEKINFLYFPYGLLHTYVRHNALYSWAPKHKKEFKSGNVNYKTGKK